LDFFRKGKNATMTKLSLTAAFASYDAKLKNVRWASSAIAEDGSLVLSCWRHFFEPERGGHKRYEDHLSRWPANHPGRNLLADHLRKAIAGDLSVRLVVATLDEPDKWVSGEASPLRKRFSTEPNSIGKVVEFDGNSFAVEFRQS
jgi:hypothetical protein